MRASDRGFLAVAAGMVLGALVAGADAPVPTQALLRPLVAVPSLPPPEVVQRGTLRAGETITGLLLRLDVPPAQVGAHVAAVASHLEVRALPVGLLAETVVDRHGSLRAVRLTPDWRSTLVLETSGGKVHARREARPVEREMVVVQGSVRSSLFEAVKATGEEEILALQLAELFQWDVDFHREVRAGDWFAFLVERIRTDGRTVAYGPIVAGAYVNAGRRLDAVRYAIVGGNAGYYDPSGRPLRKQFLRSPLRFSRVTSRFSMKRLHPVLGRRIPHYGVDYGAPTGTPVMATGDGVVAYTGWRGGGGNTVELRHPGGISTAYLHLSRFASGVRPGVRVTQGQVIGYVGSTGLSTGPHVDYRVKRNGGFVNPMSLGGEPAPPLPSKELPRFEAWRGIVLPMLARPGTLPRSSVEALAAAAPVSITS
ncbi:MAG: peptidoglycan DD-metalloendopeptidase family protein [Acidobacteriota bacterium]